MTLGSAAQGRPVGKDGSRSRRSRRRSGTLARVELGVARTHAIERGGEGGAVDAELTLLPSFTTVLAELVPLAAPTALPLATPATPPIEFDATELLSLLLLLIFSALL